MPTYAYACKDCGHAFDIQQSFSDDSLTVCPECSGTLRKKFNSVGVVFKGSGFYRTDSRDSKSTSTVPAASAKSEGGSGSDSSSSSSAASKAPASTAPAAAAS
ncbi:FmdB family zinc ribbon protein [Arthrobacter sp. USHLN218]|uniref:FmdB family zinc ribbon protein n=1 Tax=Arthrobacter sp. USHLN218 TaxID=3081232 RepID=UPI003016FC1A